MSNSIVELHANSFDAIAGVLREGKILLPERILNVMGTNLKGDCCRGKRQSYLLISDLEDKYYSGRHLIFQDGYLISPQAMLDCIQVSVGDSLLCHYNGVGKYLYPLKTLGYARGSKKLIAMSKKRPPLI